MGKSFRLCDSSGEDGTINEHGESVAENCIFSENGDLGAAKKEAIRRIKLRLSDTRFWLICESSSEPPIAYPIDGAAAFRY